MDTNKKYQSAFLVERSKLTRVLSVIQERMALLNQPVLETYEAYLTGLKNVKNTSIAEILSLDNSSRSKVERLVLIQACANPQSGAIDNEIRVDFDGKSPTDITISVIGTDAKWVLESMSVVEEQIERMLEKTLFHQIFNSREIVLLMLMVLSMVATLGAFRFGSPGSAADQPSKTMWLSSEDLAQISKSLDTPSASASDRAADVLTRQLKNIISSQNKSPFAFLSDWRILVAMSPFVVLAIALAMLRPCYPPAVFLWGDMEDWHERMVGRRKMILTVIVASILLGVLTNLAVFAFGSLIYPPGK